MAAADNAGGGRWRWLLATSEIANVTSGWTSGELAVVRVQRNAADAADTETNLAKLLTVKKVPGTC